MFFCDTTRTTPAALYVLYIFMSLISMLERMEVNSDVQLLGQRMGFACWPKDLFKFYPPPTSSSCKRYDILLRNVGSMYKGDFSTGVFLKMLSIKHMLKLGLITRVGVVYTKS
jgi:hypothetical protein